MACRPHWHATKRVMSSSLIVVPVALAYAVLLAHSWEPDTLSLILPGSLREGLAGAQSACGLPPVRTRCMHTDAQRLPTHFTLLQAGSGRNFCPTCTASWRCSRAP